MSVILNSGQKTENPELPARTVFSLTVWALIGASSLAIATAATAQELAQDQIVVTGTKVKNSSVEAPSQVTTVTSQELDLAGTANIEEVINLLPQVTPRETSGNDLNGQGVVTVDLRGIGSARTLVLINNRRLVPTTTKGAVDINNIPASLVERVEVVSGGASAVYGSDALAGVVNFILKDDFQGIELDARYGISGHGDGDKYDLNLTLGTNFDDGRGNIAIFAAYTDRSESLQLDRELHRVNINGGSSTVPPGRINNSAFNPNPTADDFFGTGGTTRNFVFTNDGGIDPFVNALPEDNPDGDRYNFNPSNLLQSPLERLSIGGFGHYDLTDEITLSLEMLYADNRTSVQFAPSPLTNALLSPTHPLLSDEARDLLAMRPNPAEPANFSKRLSALPTPRRRDFDSDLYQTTFGLEGSLGENWSWDTFVSYGRTENRSVVSGGASQSKINASLLGCPAGTEIFGCRLIDFFGDKPLSQADIDYISLTTTDLQVFERVNAGGVLSGPVLALPGGEVQSAFGFEYRNDKSAFDPSDAVQKGDLAGFATVQPTSGSFNVKEFFGELQVPVLADHALARSFGLDLGARYSDYSSVGGVFTYKAGASWGPPIEGVRFRSMYQRATRAPSVFELFQAGDRVFVNFSDPCARVSPTGGALPAPSDSVAEICILQGLPDPRLDPSITQVDLTIDVDQVGNADLMEETSKTFTTGAVLQPAFAPGMTFTVDYFSIKIDNYIGRAFGGVNGAISNCFASGVTTLAELNSHPACSLLYRDSGARLLGIEPFANTSNLTTTGIDFGLDYVVDLGGSSQSLGTLAFSGDATYTMKYEFDGVDAAGLLSRNFGMLAEWRSNARLTWSKGEFVGSLNWQRINGSIEEVGGDSIPSVNYFDFTGRYAIDKKVEIYAGVNNLMDKKPPAIRNQLNNTDVHTYDVLGRYFFVGAKVRY